MNAKPFLKWAGGKSQLMPTIKDKYPKSLGYEINRYCEPFVGGGAVFFDILSNYTMNEILINDINLELINTYKQIQENINSLIVGLENIEKFYLCLNTEQRKLFYYEKRNLFNNLKVKDDRIYNVEKAVLFIFLNRTCFNGLFRVNSKGHFNVPMGEYKKPIICDKTNLIAIHELMKNVKITCADYKTCLSFIDKDTFIYIDPPYRPLNSTSNFTSYVEKPFDDKSQIELSIFINEISKKNAKFIISNSDPKNTNEKDNFFDDLYNAFSISRVSAKRMINCNAENRGCINELLISNF